ncbi:MAG: hypothetical protein AAGF77_11560, partial [Bacteroidota bacterium]
LKHRKAMKNYKFNIFCLLVVVGLMVSCSNDENDDQIDVITQPSLSDVTIWNGPTVTFLKSVGSDPSVAENQDRITSRVWITRANDGGQIYNAVLESSADKDASPAGTLWARGTTANLQNLTFDRFRAAVEKPKDIVGEDLVLLLEEDRIAIDVKITSWSQQQLGGFAYERSSAPAPAE